MTTETPTPAPAFHLPVRPYGPIDALNRRAAAVGSPGYAMMTAHANYNGHHVTVSWNEYRGYYIAEYWWAGRCVLTRGDFARCLAAAIQEYQRGALGSSVGVYPRADDTEAVALCEATPELVAGMAPQSAPAWMTWRHDWAARSVRDAANPRAIRTRLDWTLMQEAADEAAYEAALKAKYGCAYEY